jgi:membrane fusion protein (multidrug efflux system)
LGIGNFMKIILILFFLLNTVPAFAGNQDELECVLEPREITRVSSQIPGIIDQVLVDRGDTVHIGQTVALLKAGVEKAAVDLSRARAEFGKRKLERSKELYRKQMLSVHEKDEMETEVRLAELELWEAEERLAMRTIVSPINGVVVERTSAPGEYIGEGSILTLAQINPLNVEVVVPVSRLGTIRKGNVAEVRPESPVTDVYMAKVVLVDKVIDTASATFGVRLQLDNPKNRLPAGLKCRTIFLGK